jgi:hypothetical protein
VALAAATRRPEGHVAGATRLVVAVLWTLMGLAGIERWHRQRPVA